MKQSIKIAIVAGEPSGDLLGAGLIKELKKCFSSIEWTGIGGPKMIEEGFVSQIDMQKLSVMGIKDALWHYPMLSGIRTTLYEQWKHNPPDVFIGIDYSYFNLTLEYRLKKVGIKTVHMVSPKIWAWRHKRVFHIKKAVDLVLTLFPFEEDFYKQYQVPVRYIGHPLADVIDLEIDKQQMRAHLNIDRQAKIIAVLPGSRISELKYIGPLFLDVMHELSQKKPEVQFIIPMATPKLKQYFLRQLQQKNYAFQYTLLNGQSHQAIAAADLVLVKSGTATLETMLLKRPMVVAFRWSRLSHLIVAPQIKIKFTALPNILANKELVPEFIQKQATPQRIVEKILSLLDNITTVSLHKEFTDIHLHLRKNSSQQAALAILHLLTAG